MSSHHGSEEKGWTSKVKWALLRLAMNVLVFGIIAAASYLIFFVYSEKAFAVSAVIIILKDFL